MSIICCKKMFSTLASTYVAAKINSLQPGWFGITAFEFKSSEKAVMIFEVHLHFTKTKNIYFFLSLCL